MELERNADWLAAYAVGLAYSMRPTLESVHDLQLAAGGRPELLDRAVGRLQELTLSDVGMRAQAAALLGLAASSIAALG